MVKLLIRTLIGLVALTLILLALPFFISAAQYKQELESQLTKALGRDVTLGAIRWQILPTPAFSAQRVIVMSNNTAQGEMFANSIHIFPDFRKLLDGQVEVTRIHVGGLATNQAFIEAYVHDFIHRAKRADGPPLISLQQISATAITVRTKDNMRLGPYQIRLYFSPDYRLRRLYAARTNNSMAVELTSHQDGYLTTITAQNWTPPKGPQFHFDSLVARGILGKGELALSEVSAQGYGGRVTGPATIGWRKGWRVTAQLRAQSMDMEPFLKVVGAKYVAGRFHADMHIALQAPEASRLFSDPYVDGEFRITEGVISKASQERPIFVFQEFSGHGVLKGREFGTRDALLKAYGGHFSGNPKISWAQGWELSGAIAADSINMEELLAGFVEQRALTGRFSAKATARLAAPRFSQLMQDPFLEGRFMLEKGAVYNTTTQNPAFLYNEFTTLGRLEHHQFHTRDAVLKAHGGVFTGDPMISWASDWQLTTKLRADSIDVESLLSGFVEHKALTGYLSGTATVRLSSPKFGALLQRPRVEGQLTFTNGTIYNTTTAKPVFYYDELSTMAKLEDHGIETSLTTLKAYGGHFKGSPNISWEKDWRVDTDVTAESINAEQLLAGFTENPALSGTFNGRGRIQLAAADFGQLLEIPTVTGEFHLREGVIHRADLEQASKSLATKDITGGRTPFKELSGQAIVKQHHVELKALKIVSANLQARGDVQVDDKDQLDGEMKVGLGKTSALISLPILVSGTVAEPRLRLANDAIIGGAVGTGVLGPGVGTAVGIKAGEIIKRIGSMISGDKEGEDDQE